MNSTSVPALTWPKIRERVTVLIANAAILGAIALLWSYDRLSIALSILIAVGLIAMLAVGSYYVRARARSIQESTSTSPGAGTSRVVAHIGSGVLFLMAFLLLLAWDWIVVTELASARVGGSLIILSVMYSMLPEMVRVWRGSN